VKLNATDTKKDKNCGVIFFSTLVIQGVQSELLEQRQSFLSSDTFYELPYAVKPSECLQKSSIFFLFIEY
jgi:hypothetical protein